MARRILLIGGGIMGAATAHALARAGAAADVTVVEPDPTYQWAATPRAVGGIRLQHALRENIEMSLYGDAVYADFANQVQGGTVSFDPGFRRYGYLFTVRGATACRALEANAALQASLGVEVHLLDRAALAARYPSFRFADVEAAALTPADGQIDPYAALMGFRRASAGLGVTWLKDRVVGLETAHGLVTAAQLESGGRIAVDTAVNLANCWAAEVCAMVGMPLPVVPRRRQQFQFAVRDAIEPIPAIRDIGGLAFRLHGQGYLSGHTDPRQPDGFHWDFDDRVFEAEIWPRLAALCPAMETLKLKGGWVGHYDMNLLDGNMILDRAPHLANFIVAAGFSGHGLQHAPAVGRAIAEMILDGASHSIELGRMGYRRVVENAPLPDDGPTA